MEQTELQKSISSVISTRLRNHAASLAGAAKASSEVIRDSASRLNASGFLGRIKRVSPKSVAVGAGVTAASVGVDAAVTTARRSSTKNPAND